MCINICLLLSNFSYNKTYERFNDIIDMDFKTIVDTIFIHKDRYRRLTNEDKESMFFIFNRYMSKQYPAQAQFFNKREIDKASAMDIWFNFLIKETRVPYWFWRGKTKKISPKTKDWKIVYDFYEGDLSVDDILLFEELYPNDLKDEIKRVKNILKETGK